MEWTCSTHKGDEKCIQILVEKPEGTRPLYQLSDHKCVKNSVQLLETKDLALNYNNFH